MDARLLALFVFGCTAEPAQVQPDAAVVSPDDGVDEGPAPDMRPVDMALDMAVDMAPDMTPDVGVADCEYPTGLAVARIVLLHSNDGASALLPQGQSGGIARFVTAMNRLRLEAENLGHRVISLTTGDNLLAGPTFAASLERGVPYFDAIGLAAAGFDAMAIGNHDFDFGPEIFARFVESFDAIRAEVGAAQPTLTAPVLLGANVRPNDEPVIDALRVDGRLVQSAELEGGVGLVGVSTPDIELISSPGAVTIDPPLGAVEAAVDALLARGVRFVVLVSHLRDAALEERIASEVAGIDVVIAGSTDDLLGAPDGNYHAGDSPAGPYPRVVCGPDGPVPFVTTGGAYRYIGRLMVELNDAGQIVGVDDSSGPVRVGATGLNAVDPDPFVEARVTQPVSAALDAFADNEVALSSVQLDGRRVNLRTGETNLGSLVADALLWEVEEFVFGTESPVPDIGILNAGAIRNNAIVPPGSITELDTFAMLPFASFVVETHLSRADLKALLENGVSQVESGSGRFPQVAGMRFTWSPSGAPRRLGVDGEVAEPGSRVISAELLDGTPLIANGQVVDGPDLVVATLDFLSRGGDEYPFPEAGVGFGISYQQALRDYVAGALEGEITAARYPLDGAGRIVRQE